MHARIAFPRTSGGGEFARMTREMDRLLETFAPSMNASREKGSLTPPINLWQDAQNLYAEAELPGVSAESVEVLAQGDTLTIKGSRTIDHGEGVIHAERRGGAFERTLTLPLEVDTDKISAALRDGVLTITLPKAQGVLPRKIAVNAN